ncbi:acyltransferase [Rhodohalobacter sp. SW132]|uniref:carbon-nitrogen hydrolase n=1 Tax=Rhodohalobacter sp. SW132 TaxID=2293433 RepID=UPI000E2425CF|nr:carbon-nitrogen hydrolase [Rhodohalobacter sp. SW132]REL33557.1 acyltransferase [Rhodohalobacter sp. SW132]
MSRAYKLSLIQTAVQSDKKQNLEHTETLIREAAAEGANVICLQELFNTEYFCSRVDQKNFELAESIPGPATNHLAKVAAELSVVLLVPLFEKASAGIYFNSMAVIDADGSLLGIYRKMHIPEDPGFHEKYYFTPGDLGYKVFDTAYGKIGTLICWDQWFPEAARITALKGADLLVYPTAIGTLHTESSDEKQQFLNAWKTIQRSHAIANGCYVAGVNRVGREEKSLFWGNSFVAGPFGDILAEAGEGEQILSVQIDPSQIEPQRQTWPFMRDRRIDSYHSILKRIDG